MSTLDGSIEAEQRVQRKLMAGGNLSAGRQQRYHRAMGASACVMYGITNCDTIKKARAWLSEHNVNYRFHDYKTDGIQAEQLRQWSAQVGWELLLNRAGTTFRKLPEATQRVADESQAISLMVAQPSMIKRPVLEVDGKIVVGFRAERYAEVLLR